MLVQNAHFPFTPLAGAFAWGQSGQPGGASSPLLLRRIFERLAYVALISRSGEALLPPGGRLAALSLGEGLLA